MDPKHIRTLKILSMILLFWCYPFSLSLSFYEIGKYVQANKKLPEKPEVKLPLSKDVEENKVVEV